ncbi:DUF2062 domain-containing protein [Salidesulfovibrio brasiliensis]|uniref:DUF2062 domain-containing protein n=1 Tax=Salidesulfovibrio brasiliensis TaxID=221711 RepID=UPI0009FA9344|nr:DUF2062 domain-containing protein [Salidesulfovibrio brasiliensis]
MENSGSKEAIWPVRLWRRRVRGPVLRELRRGVSAERVALAVIVGFVSATWPQIGTNPIMAILLSWLFRCNKAITSGISLVFTPFQYMLMIPFLRLGETILGVEHFETSVPEIVTIVLTDPIGSFEVLGMPLVHAIVGWISAWAVVGPLVFYPVRWAMRRIAARRRFG